MRATTLTQLDPLDSTLDDDTGFDFGDPLAALGSAAGMAGSALGGQGGALGALGKVAGVAGKVASGGGASGAGSAIGGIAGGALGTLLGPVGTALGGAAGSALGGAIEGLFGGGDEASPPPPPPPPPRAHKVELMTPAERVIWDRAVAQTVKLHSKAPREDAWLRIWAPERWNALRALGRSPMQVYTKAEEDKRRKALVDREKTERTLLFSGMDEHQRARLERALTVTHRAPEVYQQIKKQQADKIKAEALALGPAPAAVSTKPMDATPQIEPQPIELEASERALAAALAALETAAPDDDTGELSDDNTGAAAAATTPPADARPRPARHIAIIPLQQHQLAGILRAVPVLQKLDVRSLQLLAGKSSSARDVAGVNPATRTYHAEPGETATGIAKQLTGNAERALDLLACNPGHRASDCVWRIPPGWLVYDRADDTGAIATQRKYTVLSGDFPMRIADKLGAKATHPLWWKELKAANPDKAMNDDGTNWAGLFAGEEIGIPDSWPASPLTAPNGGLGGQASPTSPIPGVPGGIPSIPGLPPGIPGIPGLPNVPNGPTFPNVPSSFPPANGTQDAGVMLQAQGMLAYFATQHPCNPADFGKSVSDFTGTQTPRTAQAIQSFQVFWNQSNPMQPVRMDGTLDDATYKGLYMMTAAQMQKPIPSSPIPALPPSIPSIPQLPPSLPQLPIPSAPNTPAVFPQGQGETGPIGPAGVPSSVPGMPNQPGGPIGTQVPGLPPGWTWQQPQGPFGMPWQAPTPGAPPQQASNDAPSSSGSSTSALVPMGLAAAALALL
jgi:hypothetical protein